MSIIFVELIQPVASRLLGDHNKQLSQKDELRYGSKGSLSIHLKKGTFYDHESKEGGGVLDLIKRNHDGDPLEWLRKEGLIKSDTIVATFDYQDEKGTLLFQVCRTATKGFKQRRPNGGGGWIWKLEGVRRVPYRLPELISETGVVFIPEGEKHVDTLRALGLRATCNSGGAGKWRPEYGEFLRGADVVVMPDNDDVGRDHAQNIARALHGVANRVRILELPDLKPKGDVIDWLAAGGTVEKLSHLAAQVPEWSPPDDKPGPAQQGAQRLSALVNSVADLQTMTFDPLRWIVPGYLPEGLSLLAGKPKIGKSFCALDVAAAVASGGECLGKKCEQGDVLALFLEDSKRRLQRRLGTMLGTQIWPDCLSYATEWPRLTDGGLDLIHQWIGKVRKPRLIIIDILERVRQRATKVQTSQYSADYEALAALQKLATEAQLSILVLHHQRKMGAEDRIDTVSGTLGLGGVVDTVLILGKDDTGNFLYGRGRDLEEFEVAVQQDDQCRWQVLGPKPDAQASPERVQIVAALSKTGRPMTVDEVAAAVGSKKVNVKNLLSKLRADGEVERVATGLYKLPNPQATLSLDEVM